MSQPKQSSKWLKLLKNISAMVVMFMLISTAVDAWRGRNLDPQAVPLMTYTDLQGTTEDWLERSYSEPVIVYFWATWCPVCTYVTPTVNWMAADYPVVTVALRSGSDAKVAHYLEQQNYQLITVNDPLGQVGQQWQITATPTVAIIHEGEIVSYTTGITTPTGLWWRRWWASFSG